MNYDDVLVVIPARYKSSRLPGKPLVSIAGKPMIVRTAQRCLSVVPRDRVVVATDDERIAEVCEANNIRFEMTSPEHQTGTDRVAEVATRIEAQTYVNVQGDEPVFNPADIRAIVEAARTDRTKTFIGYCALGEAQWRDSKYIKLTFGLEKNLIYIGRAMVPGSHDGAFHLAYRQVCAYAYPREVLDTYATMPGRTPLELIEDCEVVRFLELGLPIQVVPMSDESIAVDRPQDVTLVEERLRLGGGDA